MQRAHHAVRTLLPFSPLFAPPHASLRQVATNLRDNDAGALLVGDANGFGILSERDVISALADGGDPDEVFAGDIMTRDVMVAEAHEEIVDVGLAMLEAHVRHIVIVEDDVAVGVVSLRDIAALLLLEALTPEGE